GGAVMAGGVNVAFCAAPDIEPDELVQVTPLILPAKAAVVELQTVVGAVVMLFRLSTRTVAVAEQAPLVAVTVTVWFCVGAVIAAGVKVVFCPLVGDTEPALVVQLIPATPLVTAAVPLVHIAAGALMLVVR